MKYSMNNLHRRRMSIFMNFIMFTFLKNRRRLWIVLCVGIPIILFVFTYKHFTLEEQEILATEAIMSALGSRNVIELVQPDTVTTLINGGNIKSSSALSQKSYVEFPLLIIIISSLPANKYRRDLIRNSWAKKNYIGDSTIVRFFIGNPNNPKLQNELEMESELHGDLIMDDFEEHYYKLPIKSLRMIKWFLQNKSPQTKYYAKTDDDVYINVTNVISYLDKQVKTEEISSFIGGHMYENVFGETDPFSKWYLPPNLWPAGKPLPPFVGGPFYIMSSEVANQLLAMSQSVPIIHLEDVFISGILGSYKLKLVPRNIPNVFSTIPLSYWPRINYIHVKYFFNPKSILAYHTYSNIAIFELLYETST